MSKTTKGMMGGVPRQGGPAGIPRPPSSTEEVVPRKRKPPGRPPYRIVFVSPCWHRGGLETVTITHLNRLPRDLWEPSILTGDVRGMGDSVPEGVPITVDPSCFERVWAPANPDFPKWFQRARLRSLYQFRKLGPDVMVGQLAHGSLYAANDASVPVIAEYIHCGWSWDAMHHPSDVAIAVSDATAQRLTDEGRRLRVPIERVYNGIDTDLFRWAPYARNDVRAELGIPLTAKVIGFVGRVSHEKNPCAWVRVVKRLRGQLPEAVGLVLGDLWDPTAVFTMRREAQRCGLEWGRDLFQAQCPYPEMPRHYCAMDVLLHCRRDEPFGMILPEALLCGVPVVAYAGGGVPEIAEALGKPRELQLVRAGSERDLAEAVLAMLRHGTNAVALREGVAEVFGAERMSREFQSIILEELSHAASTGGVSA